MNPGLLLAFDDELEPARALAEALDVPLALIGRHVFPDGELRLNLPPRLPEQVLLLRGLHRPNVKLAELLITAPAARELGARRLVLVAPYLAYMRQDIEFTPGEAVSQRHIGAALARLFDAVVTVDPHLHRISRLDQVMPGCQAVALSAAALLGDWVARQVPGALLLGPDEESAQWVSVAAREQGLQHAVCVKQRLGDRDVRVALPPGLDCRDRAVVLMDDMASTGRTLIEAAHAARAAGAASVAAVVTHGLFTGDALAAMRAAGIERIWASDAVPLPDGVQSVALAPLLAAAVRAL
ncbi:MAG: ribose-phosphate diphosphokinase [Burkholderiaceae bacterium]|nr:ribose-phosphate diphosphokinase [Burkholderiaceae bacterium]